MSVKIIGAVWDRSTVKGNDLLVLLALADNADEDRALAWPSVETIARKARVDRRTAQRCLRRLEAAGEIGLARAGGKTPEGYRTAVYRVTPGQGRQSDAATAGAAAVVARGGSDDLLGASPVTPQPSENRPEPSTSERARGREPIVEDFPSDFPEQLRPVTERATAILSSIATARPGAHVVKLGAVSRAIMRYPDRDYVAVAQDAEHYLLFGDGATRSYSDLVRFYGNSLSRSPRVALAADAPRPAVAENVTPLRPNASEAERRRARQADRARRASGEWTGPGQTEDIAKQIGASS